ncbi:DUF2291 family protein [Martelella soudanensis]|uniref:DUF2291 family protein n=1 Tax=unclassified Martelella TaxID=2629616 RepID=UPI0015DE3EC2|nr:MULTISPECIES: DUF2291 domain-containing protein [unclassified Martelella]
MHAMKLSAAILALLLPLGGCKLVPTDKPDAETAAAQTDEARMAAYADENWSTKVLPVIAEHTVDYDTLQKALSAGVETAGNSYGLRPEGEANPWNFVVSGAGTVTEAKLDSRAARMEVDMNGDGKPDVTLQIGPIIRGTALRDAMPFIVFTDFRDQIEFAKLARAMNEKAHAGLDIPEGDVIGKTVSFTGVYTMRSVDDAPEIVPTVIEVDP